MFQYNFIYYSGMNKNKIFPFAAAWRNLEGIILSEVCQTKNDKYHMICVEYTKYNGSYTSSVGFILIFSPLSMINTWMDKEYAVHIYTMEYYCFSVPKLCLTLCDFMYCSMPGSSVLHCLLFKFMSIELVMLSNHLILCHPLLLLPSVFSSIKVFSNASSLHIRWPRNWRFNFSNSPSSKYSGFISFRIDRFDLQSIIKEYYSDIKKKKIMH